jgi:hypothetical protein
MLLLIVAPLQPFCAVLRKSMANNLLFCQIGILFKNNDLIILNKLTCSFPYCHEHVLLVGRQPVLEDAVEDAGRDQGRALAAHHAKQGQLALLETGEI